MDPAISIPQANISIIRKTIENPKALTNTIE